MEYKKCTKCSHTLSLQNFRYRQDRKNYGSWCRRCESMKNIESTYGISIQEYEDLRIKQGHSCAICGTHEDEINTRGKSTELRHRKLVIDHNHLTGKVRGLLCHDCNVALGNLKDSIPRLTSAITYLRTTTG